ncbi:MAG: alpha/beta fold hydrolase [Dehalococcoidia bacterium]
MPTTTAPGIVTYYEDLGRGSPVILIHGHSVDLRMWQHQLPALLEAGFRVIPYDVRGHGRSAVPAAGYTWEHYAADLSALLDHLGLESAHLVGISMGGGIALQTALDSPHRILSLTLVDTSLPGFTYSQEFTRRMEELIQAVRAEGPRPAFERLWLSHPFFANLRHHRDRFALLREMALAYPAADYRDGAIPPHYAPTVVDRLGEIAAPALVIVGQQDIEDFRLIAGLLAANLPSARQLVLPGCGHVPPLEDAAAFNSALIAFLRQTSANSR